jgi:asparagine synthase (glutamine-hydrolysing)
MCGIVGRVSRQPMPPLDTAALVAIRHRGPDLERTERGSPGGWAWDLGFARLAIVDLSEAGGQPMRSEDGSLIMVFNGEIYNAPALRAECEQRGHRFQSAMDGEVILHLWEDRGPECLAQLNGIFALAMLDTQTAEVFLARDPIGVKPLFYGEVGSTLWFGSEIRAVLAAGAPRGPDDRVALAQFLTFLWIPDPRTPYAGVRSLLPGTVLRWSEGVVSTRAYGTALIPQVEPRPTTRRAAVQELGDRLHQAVQRQLMGDVPVGLMASGGVDSSLLWSGAKGSIDRAFTISWSTDDGPDEGLSEDAKAVRELELMFGTPVQFIKGVAINQSLTISGDLFADPAHSLTRLIAKAAQHQGFKVLLSGQGGDELFAGYRRHQVAPLLAHGQAGRATASIGRLIAPLYRGGVSAEYVGRLIRALAERDPLNAYMQLCTYSNTLDRARALDCDTREVTDEIVWERHRAVWDSLPAELSILRRAMALDLAVYLPGLGLAYVDRASMDYGVEVRVPWLDLELVRWSLTLPDSVLVCRGRGKYLPRTLATQQLTRRLAQRPKRGFAAPIRAAQRNARAAGSRGFRQGHYFDLAHEILQQHLLEQDGLRTLPVVHP